MKKILLILGLICPYIWISCTQNDFNCPEVERSLAACTCPSEYDPVCGCNNKTYPNSCIASCAGINHFSLGECP